jgi:hypothetical protein
MILNTYLSLVAHLVVLGETPLAAAAVRAVYCIT